MKTLIMKQKYLVSILVTIFTILGIQSSYAQTITASTPHPLTEANLHESVVTLTLSGRSFTGWSSDIGEAMTISGIDGVTFDNYWDVDRISDTKVTVELTFSGNIDADTPLVFTVGAGGIANYDGEALTAQLPVTAVEESLVPTTEAPLTETTLSGSLVTLTLSGRSFASWESSIQSALTISGAEGVTFDSWDVNRISDTKVTVELTFSGNIDADTPLIFTVGAGGIADYDGDALTAQIPVTAVAETLVATTETPLTETTLSGSVVTLTLSGRHFTDEWDIERALTISGIEGVTIHDVDRNSNMEATVDIRFSGNIDIDATLIITVGAGAIVNYNEAFTVQVPVTAVEETLIATTTAPLTEATLSSSVVTLTLNGRVFNTSGTVSVSGIDGVTISRISRVSNTQMTVSLTFSGNIDADSTLTITVSAARIAGYNDAFTVQLPVTAVEESLVATIEAPLTETTLSGSVVKLTLSGRSFVAHSSNIARASSISGIEGVTGSFRRVSNTEAKITLGFSENIDADSTLTITVGADAIVGYNEAFTVQLPVTAVVETLVATTEAPLTETTLSGSVVTLTLSGRSFNDRYDVYNALTVSGIEGASFYKFGVDRISNTKVTVPLTFFGNIDADSTLTLTVGANAIVGYNEAFTLQLPVTAVAESLVATTEAPLTETTLSGSVVTLTLNGRSFDSSRHDIERALTISGIEGVTVYRANRVSDTKVTVVLISTEDFDTDSVLTLTVGADAIVGYNQEFSFEFPVTGVEESLIATTETPLTEANLTGV